MLPLRALWPVAALVLVSPAAWAEPDSACPLPTTRSDQRLKTAPDPDAPVTVRAESVRAERGGVIELKGEAELLRGTEHLVAQYMRYDKASDTAEADGQVRYYSAGGDSFTTEWLKLQVGSRVGETGASRYRLRNEFARGDTARIEFQGPEHTRLTDARYTTCREGQDDWFLKVGTLDLDHTEEIGTARHTTVDFFGVPIFYFPYVDFPIGDQRKSGFLFPGAGHSDKLGYEAFAPYYFNLAPNYDATLTPRFLSKRGLQLQNEFRYLSPNSQGGLRLDVLPNDKVVDDDRAAGVWRHQHVFNTLWSGNIDIRGASDKEYFDDFGDRLSLTSQSYLPQTADLTYRGRAWTFVSALVDHQTIDRNIAPADQPYARLPQFQLNRTTLPEPNRLHPQLESEWNRFHHETQLNGERFNLNPGVSYSLQNDWGFVTPKIGARYIGYHLDRETDDSPAVARGLFSLDSGLFLERETRWGGREIRQTVEPRLFYLYVPSKNQDALPNFDTALPDLSFAALFRENRFTGGDRIGDANQITAAITTRFIDTDEGAERLRLSLGRIFYLDDLEVNLPPTTRSPAASDVVAEVSAWLTGNWHVRETLQWNTPENRLERNNFYLQYNPARNRIINLGHVYLRDQIGQIDVSTEWPIAGHWAMRARSIYSLLDDRNIETYLGVEYNACCWALRTTVSRRWQDPEQVNAIRFELQFNGLSKLGSAPESPLKQSLFSFDNDTATASTK